MENNNFMCGFIRTCLLIFMIFYVLNPIDVPGPVDDLIVVIGGMIARAKLD